MKTNLFVSDDSDGDFLGTSGEEPLFGGREPLVARNRVPEPKKVFSGFERATDVAEGEVDE